MEYSIQVRLAGSAVGWTSGFDGSPGITISRRSAVASAFSAASSERGTKVSVPKATGPPRSDTVTVTVTGTGRLGIRASNVKSAPAPAAGEAAGKCSSVRISHVQRRPSAGAAGGSPPRST